MIGTPERFGCGKQIASYVGVVPSEESSGDRRRLGHISKQGNSLLRFLLVEATQVTVRSNPDWRRHFHRVPDRKDYERAFDWKAQTISESEMALVSECRQLCANNVLDRADIVRDGDFSTVMDGALPQWDWHDMQDRSRSSSISGQTEKVSTRQMC